MTYNVEQLTEMVLKQNDVIKKLGEDMIKLEYVMMCIGEMTSNKTVHKTVQAYFEKQYKVLHVVPTK